LSGRWILDEGIQGLMFRWHEKETEMRLSTISLLVLALLVSALAADEKSTNVAAEPSSVASSTEAETQKPEAKPAESPSEKLPVSSDSTNVSKSGQDESDSIARSKEADAAATPTAERVAWKTPLVAYDSQFSSRLAGMLDQLVTLELVTRLPANDESSPGNLIAFVNLNPSHLDELVTSLKEIAHLDISTTAVTLSTGSFRGFDRTSGQPLPTNLSATVHVSPAIDGATANRMVEILTRNGITATAKRRPTLSLWFLKPDFSSLTPPATAELRKTLEEIGISKDKLDALPNASTQLLFPRDLAIAFTPEKTAHLYQWLHAHDLILETAHPEASLSSMVERSVNFVDPDPSVTEGEPYVKRTGRWSWSASGETPGTMKIRRSLSQSEQWRGEPAPRNSTVLLDSFQVTLEPGRVAIVDALVAKNSGLTEYLAKADRYVPLLVIENHSIDVVPSGALTDQKSGPQLVVPDAASPLTFEETVNRSSPQGIRSMAPLVAVGDLPPSQARPVETNPAGARAAAEQLRIVKLTNSNALAMAALLSQVVSRPGFTAVADERTNSVVLKAFDAESMDAAEALLTKLDEAGPSVGKTHNPLATSMGTAPGGGMSMGMGAAPGKPLSQLQKEYADREAAAAKLANELRGLQASSKSGQPAEVRELSSDEFYAQAGGALEGFIEKLHQKKLGRKPKQEEQAYWQGVLTTNGYDRAGLVREFLNSVAPGKLDADAGKSDPKQVALREQLKDAVAKAFEARQAMLAAELEVMQAQLAATRQSLEARKRISSEIVARRVEDLLNPGLKWDDAQLAGAPTSAPLQPATSPPSYVLPVDPNDRSAPSATPFGPPTAGPNGGGGAFPSFSGGPIAPSPGGASPWAPGAIATNPRLELTGIWESPGNGMGMMSGMGAYGGAGMGMAGEDGMEMSAANPPPRLLIDGNLAALYEKNERRRLWGIAVDRPGEVWTRVTFTPLDGMAGMEGSYAVKDRTLTVVSTGDDGAKIVAYQRTIAAIPPDWAKQMWAAASAKLAADPIEFRAVSRIDLSKVTPEGRPDILEKNLSGLWSTSSRIMRGGMGMGSPFGSGPGGLGDKESRPATYFVIHGSRAALYEKNERKGQWRLSIADANETQARLNLVATDAKAGMQGTYSFKGGTLSIVSSSEEGPKIVQYHRSLPVIPPEWAAEISKSLAGRNYELLHGINSGEATPRSNPGTVDPNQAPAAGPTTPSAENLGNGVPPYSGGPSRLTYPKDDAVPDEFRSRDSAARRDRQPSDYLELLDRRREVLADYGKRLQTVGSDHPQARQLQGEKARALRAIEVIQIEFEAELHSAAGEVEVKQVELKAAEASLVRERKLYESNATTTAKVRQQETATRLAEARLKAAETRLRLFELTREKLFPEKTAETDAPSAQPAPAAPSPILPGGAPQPVPAQGSPATPVAPSPAATPSLPGGPVAPKAPAFSTGPSA